MTSIETVGHPCYKECRPWTEIPTAPWSLSETQNIKSSPQPVHSRMCILKLSSWLPWILMFEVYRSEGPAKEELCSLFQLVCRPHFSVKCLTTKLSSFKKNRLVLFRYTQLVGDSACGTLASFVSDGYYKAVNLPSTKNFLKWCSQITDFHSKYRLLSIIPQIHSMNSK